jgi:hypothetical protein
MIAQGYTANGNRVKQSLEQNPSIDLRFRTWDRVIAETERMHLGWLEVSRARSRAEEPEPELATDGAKKAAPPEEGRWR